jgi:hypothetical protein
MLKKSKLHIIILTLLWSGLHAQEDFNKSFSIGTNLIKIQASTIDIIADYHFKNYLDFSVNTGYALNHIQPDLSIFLTGMCKGGNDGYIIQGRQGWYFKFGARYNFHKTDDSKFYFFSGVYLASSFIQEKTLYDMTWDNPNLYPSDSSMVLLGHKMYMFGFTAYGGGSIKLAKRLFLEIGLEAGFPTIKYKELYGYENFIPGIGAKANSDNAYWFPQILVNMKYKI